MSVWALLIFQQDEAEGCRRKVRLEPGVPCVVGRSRACDVVLSDLEVSGRHAVLTLDSGKLRLADLNSRNGSWIVRDADERRLDPGEELDLSPQDAIRIGPFHLAPCELLGDDVVLSRHTSVDGEERPIETTLTAGADEPQAERLEAALSKLVEGLRDGEASPQRSWRAALGGLVELLAADSGFLLAPRAGGYVLRAAHRGGLLSRRFVELTAERDTPWDLCPVTATAGESTPSMLDYDEGTTLTGIPIRRADGDLLAVAYLERRSGAPVRPDGRLETYVQLAAALLDGSASADRERRRGEALAGRGGEGAGAALGHGLALIGGSPLFLEAVETTRRAAASSANLLVRGPSGSGKEQLAALAHISSGRSGQPFVVLNCAALPETLVESELFGVDRGAYTGADRSREGAFCGADGGTLFLDEIGDLPLAAQAKILRVIETGEVVRVGGSRARVDVRLVTATHRNLEEMVRQGSFREDLYYRLRVIEVHLPALAERREDVIPLVDHFLDRLRRREGVQVQSVTVQAAGCLQRYGWPGNVRELRNVVDRAAILDRDGVLGVDDLPAEIRRLSDDEATATDELSPRGLLELTWPEAKERFEELYFRSALERHDGAVQETARSIGVDRRTLSTKIARHGLRDSFE